MEKLIEESFSKFIRQKNSWWRKVLTVVMFPVRLLLAITHWLLSLAAKLIWKAERWIS